TTAALTEAEVLLQLDKEDTQRVKDDVPGIHTISPSSFILAGLAVEDEQLIDRRCAHHDGRRRAGTTAQQIDIVALRQSLNGSIQRLRKLQATYTPVAILALAQRQNVPEHEQPENVLLFLPSTLTPAQRALESVHYLAILEKTVREAQCATALERLRCQLHAKSHLLTYKVLQARHQGATTRARSIVDRNKVKIRLHSEKYQMAWEAMLRLAGAAPVVPL
ncbi:hypothetical protein B0H14DRAFT_2400585, partial [Mycena olivaceomarginata]